MVSSSKLLENPFGISIYLIYETTVDYDGDFIATHLRKWETLGIFLKVRQSRAAHSAYLL